MKKIVLIILIIGLICACKSKVTDDQKTETDGLTKFLLERKTIRFLGDGFTEGFGLKKDFSYPSVLGNQLDSLGYNYQCINHGIHESTTASYEYGLDFVSFEDTEIVIIELGFSDALFGPSLSVTDRNLRSFIDEIRKDNADISIILAGINAPEKKDEEYKINFNEMYRNISQDKDVILISDILEGVSNNKILLQENSVFPTKEGTEIVADNVFRVLVDLLEK